MIAQCRNKKVERRKNTITDNDSKKYSKCILGTSISNNSRVSFHIKKDDDTDGSGNEDISTKLNRIYGRKCQVEFHGISYS